jgi:hypothetical protein
METKIKGFERERDLARDEYFSNHYFNMPQLCSFAHQLNFIHAMQPKSIIEIGIGNGFVSTFLRQAGIPIVTADINPALGADICAPLSEVCSYIESSYDLVLCCEVLEHMPLEQLDENLEYLSKLGGRLFLTLPSSFVMFGCSISTILPKIGNYIFDVNISLPVKHNLSGSSHFWEVGYNKDCSRANIIKKLKQRYTNVRSGRFKLNPYHVWFICE